MRLRTLSVIWLYVSGTVCLALFLLITHRLLVRGLLEGVHEYAYVGIAAGVSFFVAAFLVRAAQGASDHQLLHHARRGETLANRMDALEDEARVLGRINDLIEVFSETHDLEAVLKSAVVALREVLRVSSLVMHLYSHEESRFMVRIEQGAEDVNLGEEIFEDVIEKGRSRLFNDLGVEGRYAPLDRQGFQALVVAPLTRIKRGGQKEAIGLVAALSRDQRDFTSHDLHLLSVFARQAGLIIENAQLYERTQELAVRDGMTNLYNYRHFKEMLETELARAGAGGKPLALLMVDIDYFKKFNDTHGHQRGDAVLRTTAEILMRFTRGADIVARYGGDEFVVILPDTDRVGARRVGENIRRHIEEQPFPGEAESQPGGSLTTTLGLAVYPEDGRDAAKLIQAADKALYAGKETGRGRLVSADEVSPPKEE